MPLEPGAKLGRYEILSAVEQQDGSELYKASDSQLERQVAVKVFAERFSEPFELQAQAAASLNHPNIRALHEVGHEDGVDFLVMEYLEGQTLAQRLEKGALGLDEAVTLAIAIADALDKAHQAGVTHRDLNPSKVMLTQSGPKLLDFGLADPKPVTIVPAGSKTALQPGSDVSIQYLSPEQLEGKDPADARSDIFAFGTIFYEMITGTKAFEGKSRAVLIAAIATADPDPLSKTQPRATPALQHIVERCLAKDPDDRWQTAHDLLLQLRWVTEGGQAVGSTKLGTSEKMVRIGLAVAALLIVALALPAAMYLRGPTAAAPFQFRVPVRGLSQDNFALSPDGETIALVAAPNTGDPAALYVRRAGSVAFTKLGGTDDASQPFWSPDSRFIAFIAGGRLKQVNAAGGAPKDIAEAAGFSGGTWSKEGAILFGSDKGIFRVSAEGGKPAAITSLDAQETGHYWPNFLPDGRHFLYLAWSAQSGNRGVFLGTLDSKEKKRLLNAESNAKYAAPGYIVFHRDRSLFAQPFDAKKLALGADQFHIADEVSSGSANGRGDFDVSQNGSLLYFQGGANAVAASGRGGIMGTNVQWGWRERSGRPAEDAGETGPYGDMDLSPDGKLIAVTKQDTGSPGGDIWVIDWQRAGVTNRLTLDPADDINPVWAPDSKRIAFTTYRKGNADIYVVENGNGEGKETPLLETAADEVVEDWSKDGKYIAYLTGEPSFRDIWALPLVDGKPVADKKPIPVVQGHYQKDEPQFSYDGKWLAYVSDRTVPGTFQVYVRSFPAGDQDILVSATAGGGQPRWKKDGKELYYRAPDDSIMAVEIKAAAKLEAGIAHPLFTAPFRNANTRNPVRHLLSVTPDGQRFLLRVQPGTGARGGRGAGNSAIPEAPQQPSTISATAPAAPAAAKSTPGPMRTGLTMKQHWTSALEKADK